MLKGFEKADVSILPGLFRERMDINRKYLSPISELCFCLEN